MTTAKNDEGTAKRRGRRPGGQDTRAALLQAARAVFTESGYDGATVRGIAARACVDAAMVNHWFGGKEGLFAEAVLQLPFNPKEILEYLLDGDVHTLGERMVRRFLTVWDSADGGVFVALVRSVTSHEQATHVLRDFFVKYIFSGVIASTGSDRADLRATLCATQMIGLGVVRYVAQFEPLASADVDTLVAAIAPNLQRYLTGPIS
ncbi:MAG: TetR family transcriptional regulator [Haloechinothrix sp.]